MSKAIQIRIGVEGGRKAVLNRCRALSAPILVSANSLWDNRRRSWRGLDAYRGFDVALDSGGFVAMRRYGGYRWTPEEYAACACALAPSWWAQMDFCCEPELAASPAQVAARIDRTVTGLHDCQRAAAAAGIPAPLPVLQGWKPTDYTSGPAWAPGFTWPALVGVGSVCRRHLNGPTGILAVVGALDAKLPPHVRLHLFGVKSQALAAIAQRFPTRLGSSDSQAWRYREKWLPHDPARGIIGGKYPATSAEAADLCERWLLRQRASLDLQQPPLPL